MLSQLENSIGATTTEENILSGDLLEIPEEAMIYQVGLNASATGLIIDVYVGPVAIAASLIPLIKATAPIAEDFVLEFGVLPGQRVKIRVRNTTAGALTLLTSVKGTPVSL